MSAAAPEADLERAMLDMPSSRQLGTLLQDEIALSTGLAARWTADKVQGNRGGMARWTVPFNADAGSQGRFILRWDPELQKHLSHRLGAIAARPEFLGSLLRATAGRWVNKQPLQGLGGVRLQPSAEPETAAEPLRSLSSSAALLLDGHVLEIVFELDQA